MRVVSALTNDAGNNGLVIKSSTSGTGSLIHNSNEVSATVERHIAGSTELTAMQYHMVSAPLSQIANPKSGLFTGSYLYNFDKTTQAWVHMQSSPDNPLYVNQGYMIYYPNESKTYVFGGPLNNGPFSIPVEYHTTSSYTGFNLVPNPYASVIDWEAMHGWTKTNLNNANYIWGPISRNYATYVDGVAANGGTRYIPLGQSLFVQANSNDPVLTVNNDARVINTQAFLKSDQTTPVHINIPGM